MKPRKQSRIFSAALEEWGRDAQIGQLHEEMGELMVAINKYDRDPCEENRVRVMEELADVAIMWGQMVELFRPRDTDTGVDAEEIKSMYEERLRDLNRKMIDKRGVNPTCESCPKPCQLPKISWNRYPKDFCPDFKDHDCFEHLNNYISARAENVCFRCTKCGDRYTWKEVYDHDVEMMMEHMEKSMYRCTFQSIDDVLQDVGEEMIESMKKEVPKMPDFDLERVEYDSEANFWAAVITDEDGDEDES